MGFSAPTGSRTKYLRTRVGRGGNPGWPALSGWTLGDTIRTGVHLSRVRPSGSDDAPSSATGTSRHSVRPSPWNYKRVLECRAGSGPVAGSPICPGQGRCAEEWLRRRPSGCHTEGQNCCVNCWAEFASLSSSPRYRDDTCESVPYHAAAVAYLGSHRAALGSWKGGIGRSGLPNLPRPDSTRPVGARFRAAGTPISAAGVRARSRSSGW
jgi:hypothetical protein